MNLRELMKFLLRMAEANLKRHEEQNPDDASEIGYHTGQLSILNVLIPLTPLDVKTLEIVEDE